MFLFLGMEDHPLLSAIQSTLQKSKVDQLAEIVAAATNSAAALIDLTFHQDTQIGFRAAWILEQLYLKHNEKFLPSACYFLQRFVEQENPSARRHFGKILSFMTAPKAPISIKQILAESDTEQLVETVFAWLIEPKTAVAIKAHCLDILANFTTTHDWVTGELLATIDFLTDKEPIAFHIRAQKVRKRLT